MIAEVTSAALMSENKQMAAPCSVDSTPTSANQEDHVSMAAHASARLTKMNKNLATIIAVEWLCSTQGVEFRGPLQTSKSLQSAVAVLRGEIPPLEDDRFLAPDIATATDMIAGGVLVDAVGPAAFEEMA